MAIWPTTNTESDCMEQLKTSSDLLKFKQSWRNKPAEVNLSNLSGELLYNRLGMRFLAWLALKVCRAGDFPHLIVEQRQHGFLVLNWGKENVNALIESSGIPGGAASVFRFPIANGQRPSAKMWQKALAQNAKTC